MKRIVTILSIAFVLTTLAVQAQVQSAQKNMIIKPNFVLEDIVFAYNMMGTIEILGAEVDPFLECKNFLKGAIDKAQAEQKKANDKIAIEIPLVTAQNLSTFLSRGKFKGENAENYKRLMDAMVEAAKSTQK